MHKFSIVEFFLIFSTAVNVIQTLPLALYNPEQQYYWQLVPQYFVEYASPTNKVSDRSLGVQNQDPISSVGPPINSIVQGKSAEAESDTSAQKITNAPLTPTRTINEQTIENILTDVLELADDSVNSTNDDKFKTNKRSVDVRPSNEKLKAEDEKGIREDMPSMFAVTFPMPFAGMSAAQNRSRLKFNEAMRAANLPIGFYRVSPAAGPPNAPSAYVISPVNPLYPHSSRFPAVPFHMQPQRIPVFSPISYSQPIEYPYEYVNPEAINDRKPLGSDIKDGKPRKTEVLSSAGSEPSDKIRKIAPVEVETIPSKNIPKPEPEMVSTKLDDTSSVRTNFVTLPAKISTPQPGKGKSSDSYPVRSKGNEMARLPTAEDKKKTSPPTKHTVDIAGPKKKLPTPAAKPVDPKLAELKEKIRKLQAEIRNLVLNKDRNNQSKLKTSNN